MTICSIHPKKSRDCSNNWNEGFDVVYGTPKAEQNGFLRVLASRITRLALSTAIGRELAKNVSAFRVFRTRLREAFADYHSPFVSIDVLLTWTTTRIGAIAVGFRPRHSGAIKLHSCEAGTPCT